MLRMKKSSTRLSWGPGIWFINKGDNLVNSIGWTSIAEISDKEEPQNILGESCCLRIKCTAINSLITLMWRWCLNSGFQPYNYYIRTYRECWWASIQTDRLACTWKVEMKRKDSIKGEGVIVIILLSFYFYLEKNYQY